MAECASDGESPAGHMGGGGSSDDSECELTAAEVLERLELAWQNEKFAPELLNHKTDIVECILEQIREMEENLSQVKKGDFVGGIHQLELDRIRYVLCSYYRTRLHKIEQQTAHILEREADPATASRLSPEELVIAKEFASNTDSHLHSLILRYMPSNFQKIDKKKAVTRPNMDTYVFVRAVEKADNVAVDHEDAVDFEPGDQYILRYQPVCSLVHSEAFKLV